MDRDFSWMHCSNKELLKELKEKEELFENIALKILKCPHCKKGYFFIETDDREYCTDSWWMCDNLNCDSNPSKQRETMLEEIVKVGEDEYWDFELYTLKSGFEHNYKSWDQEGYENIREFDPELYNKEKEERKAYVFVFEKDDWEVLVEKTIKSHIKALDKAINKAKQYKSLKNIFKEK